MHLGWVGKIDRAWTASSAEVRFPNVTFEPVELQVGLGPKRFFQWIWWQIKYIPGMADMQIYIWNWVRVFFLKVVFFEQSKVIKMDCAILTWNQTSVIGFVQGWARCSGVSHPAFSEKRRQVSCQQVSCQQNRFFELLSDMSLNLRLSENKVYERIPTFDGWLATISNFPIHMANVSRCFKGINPIFLLNTPSFRATLLQMLQDEDEFLTSCCPHITWRQRVTGWLSCFCPVPSDLAPCPPSTCWCYGPVMVQSLRPWFIASSFKFRFIVTWHDVALCRSRKRETRLNTTVHHTSNSYVICGSVSFFIINYISACQFQPKWSADAFGAKRCSGHVLYWAIREDLPWPTP